MKIAAMLLGIVTLTACAPRLAPNQLGVPWTLTADQVSALGLPPPGATLMAEAPLPRDPEGRVITGLPIERPTAIIEPNAQRALQAWKQRQAEGFARGAWMPLPPNQRSRACVFLEIGCDVWTGDADHPPPGGSYYR